jgi:pyruvyltransferase
MGKPMPSQIHALRGPNSFMALRNSGLNLRYVPFGDPNILAPRVINIAPSAAPHHQIGIVAHYVDRQNPTIRRLMAEDGVADINVHLDPLAVIREMADCRYSLSASIAA